MQSLEVEVRRSRHSRRVYALQPLDLLSRRVRLLFFLVLDIIGLAALFLQLSPPGFPLSLAALTSRVDESATREFWFVPVAVAAAILPLMCGLILGVLAQVSLALWCYAAGTIAIVGGRLLLTFEMSAHDLAVERQALLIDIIVTTMCVFIELHACDSAVQLAVDLQHNRVARHLVPMRRYATDSRRRGRGGGGNTCGNTTSAACAPPAMSRSSTRSGMGAPAAPRASRAESRASRRLNFLEAA